MTKPKRGTTCTRHPILCPAGLNPLFHTIESSHNQAAVIKILPFFKMGTTWPRGMPIILANLNLFLTLKLVGNQTKLLKPITTFWQKRNLKIGASDDKTYT